MYFEEKFINGILHFRTSPDGQWRAFSLEDLSGKYESERREKALLQSENERLTALVKTLREIIDYHVPNSHPDYDLAMENEV